MPSFALLNQNTTQQYLLSCDISKTELGQIQEEAYPVVGGYYPDLEKAVCQHDAWVFQRTLQQYNNLNSWPSCPAVVKTQKCRAPNEWHTPDMLLLSNQKIDHKVWKSQCSAVRLLVLNICGQVI